MTCGYVVEHLGGPDRMLVVDETAISRRGHPVPGACKGKLRHGGQGGELPGRGVPQLRLGAGHALIDRKLDLPASWVANPGRCAATGIPEGTVFATKPELALRTITRALDAGTPADWLTGDAVYGADSGLGPAWRICR